MPFSTPKPGVGAGGILYYERTKLSPSSSSSLPPRKCNLLLNFFLLSALAESTQRQSFARAKKVEKSK